MSRLSTGIVYFLLWLFSPSALWEPSSVECGYRIDKKMVFFQSEVVKSCIQERGLDHLSPHLQFFCDVWLRWLTISNQKPNQGRLAQIIYIDRHTYIYMHVYVCMYIWVGTWCIVGVASWTIRIGKKSNRLF